MFHHDLKSKMQPKVICELSTEKKTHTDRYTGAKLKETAIFKPLSGLLCCAEDLAGVP